MTTTEVGWRACESQVLVMDKLMNYIWIRSNRVGSIKKNHMITLQPWDNVAKCNSDDNCCRLHVRGRLYTIHVFYDFIFSRWYAITVPFSREIEMHLYHFVGLNICWNWFEKHQFCIKNHIKSNKISISNYRKRTSWPLSWNYHLSADLFFITFVARIFSCFIYVFFVSPAQKWNDNKMVLHALQIHKSLRKWMLFWYRVPCVGQPNLAH